MTSGTVKSKCLVNTARFTFWVLLASCGSECLAGDLLLRAIADYHATDTEAFHAIEALSSNAEESSYFWLKTINDGTMPAERRRMCMIQFFVRKVPGLSLGEFVVMPGVTSWFRPRQIRAIRYLGGMLPFKEPIMSRSAFVLRPDLPANNDSEIYMLLDIPESEEQFARALTGKTPPPKAVRILDVGAVEVLSGGKTHIWRAQGQ